MTDDIRRANALAERDAAQRFRDSAERIADVGEYEAAANRLYYAALHQARAVCVTKGLEPRRHRALQRMLTLHFVNAGELPDWVVASLGQLETERDLADYAAGYSVPRDRYEQRRDGCDGLMRELGAYLARWLDETAAS